MTPDQAWSSNPIEISKILKIKRDSEKEEEEQGGNKTESWSRYELVQMMRGG